ncbi:MAG TPA: hypothetical protein VF796_02440, partial [Humisphaera sp.]
MNVAAGLLPYGVATREGAPTSIAERTTPAPTDQALKNREALTPMRSLAARLVRAKRSAFRVVLGLPLLAAYQQLAAAQPATAPAAQ